MRPSINRARQTTLTWIIPPSLCQRHHIGSDYTPIIVAETPHWLWLYPLHCARDTTLTWIIPHHCAGDTILARIIPPSLCQRHHIGSDYTPITVPETPHWLGLYSYHRARHITLALIIPPSLCQRHHIGLDYTPSLCQTHHIGFDYTPIIVSDTPHWLTDHSTLSQLYRAMASR